MRNLQEGRLAPQDSAYWKTSKQMNVPVTRIQLENWTNSFPLSTLCGKVSCYVWFTNN